MALTYIRPNTDISNTSGWTKGGTGPPATFNAALLDGVSLLDTTAGDDTYAISTVTGGGASQTLGIGFGTWSIPAGSNVSGFRLIVRAQYVSGPYFFPSYYVKVNDPVYGIQYIGTGEAGFLDTAGVPVRGTIDCYPTKPASLGGGNWTQSDIDNMFVEVFDNADFTHVGRVLGLSIEITYNALPTFTVTAPVEGSVATTTTRPTVTGTYADAEGDPQERLQVKIFTSAIYGLAGFDPETFPAFWDSGILYTSNNSVTPDIDLPPTGAFRAYGKVSPKGSAYWGVWDYNTFSMTVITPAPPTINPIVENANARVRLEIQGRDNLQSANVASIETDATGWVASTNATISRSTSQAAHGVASLLVTSVASGDMQARVADASLAIAVPGKQYVGRASFRSSVSPRQVQVELIFKVSAGGATLSTITGPLITDSTSSWKECVVTGIAPLTTTVVMLLVRVKATGAASENHFVDKASVAPIGNDNLIGPEFASNEFESTTWIAYANCTLATSSAQALHGSKSLEMSSVASGNMQARTVGYFAVTPGKTYTALASFRSAVSGRSVLVSIWWYTAAGGFVTSTNGLTVVDTTTGWVQSIATGTAGATIAQGLVVVQVSATGGAAEVHYVDSVIVYEGADIRPFTLGDAGWSNGGFTGITYVIEYSDTGLWLPVRNASAITPDTLGQAVVYDHEARLGGLLNRQYRARARMTV